ncbi:hypothetical protein ACXZ65_10860 [Streptomyces aculeolatus]
MAGLTEAEEERLRKALGVIAAESAVVDAAAVRGEAAAGEEGEAGWAEPPGRARGVRGVRRGRRVRRAVAVALSAAAVAAFCFLAYTAIGGAETDRTAKGGAGGGADADGKGLTLLENAACTKRLLEGTVADVEKVPHPPNAFPWVEVTLTDVRWHTPPSTETRTTVRVPDPEEWNDEKPFARGEHLLVEDLGQESVTYYRSVPGKPMLDLETVRDERLRAMNKAQEKGVRCPSFWVNRDG